MKLKTRLLGAFLLVATLPLLIQGVVFHIGYRDDLTTAVQDHLRSVAGIQQSRLTAILGQNEERLALVASRTQLRMSLRDFLDTGDPHSRERMNRILTDAAASIAGIVCITVYDPVGVAVASTEPDSIGRAHFDPNLLEASRTRTVVDRLHLVPEGHSQAHLSGPMLLDGRNLGEIVLYADVQNLLASLGDYAGLGETGETVLARREPDGGFVFLAPTRFDREAALRVRIPPAAPGDPAGFLDGSEGRDEKIDYRGQRVLAVTRPVPGTDWVLAVKIDRDEALADLDRVTHLSLLLLIALLTAAIAVAVSLTHTLTAPLIRLAGAARAVADGDYTQRLAISSDDELGSLEAGFNHMSEQIARQMAEIKSLEGIIPICAQCKKIRDDQGYWTRLEAYLSAHSQAMFSHGLCPDCLANLEREIDDS